MGKRQKKLIELLEKEGLMDKELKNGCIVELYYYPGNYEDHSINEYHGFYESDEYFLSTHGIIIPTTEPKVIKEYKRIKVKQGLKMFNVMSYSNELHYNCYYGYNKDYQEIIKKIIGQYHLGSIFQWFGKQKFDEIYCHIDGEINFCLYEKLGKIRNDGEFKLDIIKPVMEWTEKQNKELVEFMENFNL